MANKMEQNGNAGCEDKKRLIDQNKYGLVSIVFSDVCDYKWEAESKARIFEGIINNIRDIKGIPKPERKGNIVKIYWDEYRVEDYYVFYDGEGRGTLLMVGEDKRWVDDKKLYEHILKVWGC